jgi:hypothetical protein
LKTASSQSDYSTPRKPPQSAGEAPPTPQGGFFKFPHELLPSMAWGAKPGCEQFLLLIVMSEANLRGAALDAAGRKRDGLTKPLATEDCEKLSGGRWTGRMIEEGLANLLESGMLERFSRQHGLDQGYITKKEAGPARFAHMYRCRTDRWAEIAAKAKAKTAAVAEERKKNQRHEGEPKPKALVFDKPVRLVPFQTPDPVFLTAGDRLFLGRCRQIEFNVSGKTPIEVTSQVDGEVLRYSLAACLGEAPAADQAFTRGPGINEIPETSAQGISAVLWNQQDTATPSRALPGPEPDPLTAALAALDPPVPIQDSLLKKVRAELSDTPRVTALFIQIVKWKHAKQKRACKPFEPGLLLNLAGDANEAYAKYGEGAFQMFQIVDESGEAPPARDFAEAMHPYDKKAADGTRETLRAMRVMRQWFGKGDVK